MSLAPGTRLGRYEIRALIGAGGMGEVYRAHDARLGRDVAVKLLTGRSGDDGEMRARFEREARAAARLSHPNIVAIHDVGEDGGAAYAVMELLEGQSLRDRLKQGRLPGPLVRDYARQIAGALAAAHAKGVVHRDLKPENVFLQSSGPLKLVDFGIARLLESSGRNSATTNIGTEMGTLLGTVEYMSPEQLRGEPVDHRSDLFSFGIVLHEMITGARPFGGKTTVEIAASILTGTPPLVARTSPDQDAARLAQVAARCLQKEPSARFATAEELLVALDPETGSASEARTPSPPQGQSVAVLPFTDLSLDRNLDFFCDGIAEEILSKLSRVPGLRVAARSSSFQFKGRSDDARHIGQTLNVATVLEGSVRSAGQQLRIVAQLVDTVEGYQVWSERFDRRLDDIFAVQDEIAGAVVAALEPAGEAVTIAGLRGVGTTNLDAYTLYLKGRHHWNKRTESDLERAVSYYQDAVARDPQYAEARGALAEAYVTLGLYGARAPMEVMPLARSTAADALARQPALASALATQACVDAVFHWAWSEAERGFRQAIALVPQAPAPHHWYAINCLVPRRRFDEARAELALALAADPLSPAIVATLGITAYFERRYTDAESELGKAIALHSNFAMAHLFLGLTYLELGGLDLAASAITAAAALSPGSPEMTSAQGILAARAGDVAAAHAALHALTELAGTRYVSPVLTAQVQAALGDTDSALSALETAWRLKAADLIWLPTRPVWDGLRGEPRFQHILGEAGLR